MYNPHSLTLSCSYAVLLQLPRRQWVSMLRFIALPLMRGQWRGRVFDAASTSVVMQKLQQVIQFSSPRNTAAEVSQLQYALTENLSSAIMFANELRC